MSFSGRRWLNLAGFVACALMMGYALYAEYVLLLEPCPLCVLQRVAVSVLGIAFLLACLHHPAGRSRVVYAVAIGLVSAAGIAVAGRHVWLQHMPADQVPSCGPGFDYIFDSFPFLEALRLIYSGSGECAAISWRAFGLSMPAWVLILVAVIGALGVWNNLRAERAHRGLAAGGSAS